MKLKGRVVNGHVEIEGAELPEGADAVVLIGEDEAPYELTAEEDEELWQAHLEIAAGRGIPAEKILDKLRRERSAV